MNDKFKKPTEKLGLLASGSCHRWHIDVDESLDGKEWFLELDGPQSYLAFQLKDLQVVPAALRFLESHLDSPEKENVALTLGEFGGAFVSLLWDNEGTHRCFLVISPEAQSAIRITWLQEDIEMVIDALRQVMKDLPEGSGSTSGNN